MQNGSCQWVEFLGPFRPQICFSQFSGKVSTGFTGNLTYKFIGATFIGVQKISH